MKRSLKQSAWTSRSFPFYAETVEGVHGESRALHWHRELEITRIRRGGGKHLVNGREYEANEGDIFLIDNDEIHLLFDEHDKLLVQVFLFDPALVCTPGADLFDQEYLRPFSGESGGYSTRLPADGPGMAEMRGLLDEMEWEYQFRGAEGALLVKGLLLQFLAAVVRNHGLTERFTAVSAGPGGRQEFPRSGTGELRPGPGFDNEVGLAHEAGSREYDGTGNGADDGTTAGGPESGRSAGGLRGAGDRNRETRQGQSALRGGTGTKERQRKATRGIRMAMEYMEAEFAQPISLASLTDIAGMSVSHFCSTFRKLTNTTPNEFLIRCRLSTAKEKLRKSEDKILEIAQSCGFETLSNFNRAFLNHVGMTPGEYRRS